MLCVESLNRKEDDLLTIERSLATLYVHGADLDWGSAVAGARKIPLPSYPWDEQRYAFFQDSPQNERLVRGQHPLLQERQHTPGESWRTEVNRQFFPWLDDHKIQGHAILPGAAYAETLLACAALHGKADDSWAIRDVQLASIQPTAENVEFSVSLDADTVSIHARKSASDPWEHRVSGRIVRTPLKPHFPAIDPQRDTLGCQVFEQDAIYRTALENGYGFGPAFQVVKQFFVRGSVIFSRIDAAHLGDEVHDYHVHPVVLDGIFQVLNGIYVAGMPAARHGQYLPAAVGEIRIFKRGIQACWVRCEVPDHAERNVDLDISVHGLDGTVIGEIRGYRSKVVSAGDRTAAISFRDKLYTITWEHCAWPEVAARNAGPSDGRWLVFADRHGRSNRWIAPSRQHVVAPELWQSPAKLREQLDSILAAGSIVGALYAWSLDVEERDASPDRDIGLQDSALLLQLLQALAARQRPGFLKTIVLTDGAVPNEAGCIGAQLQGPHEGHGAPRCGIHRGDLLRRHAGHGMFRRCLAGGGRCQPHQGR